MSLKEKYNLVGWNNISIFIFHFFNTATFSLLLTFPVVIGEKIEWRGFLVPQLAKLMSFTWVAVFSDFLRAT